MEYRLHLDNSRKDISRQTIQPKFHSDRKKDIQKKIRQLVENRNAKKPPLFDNGSYHELYSRNSKTVAHQAHRRSLRRSIESKDSNFNSNGEPADDYNGKP